MPLLKIIQTIFVYPIDSNTRVWQDVDMVNVFDRNGKRVLIPLRGVRINQKLLTRNAKWLLSKITKTANGCWIWNGAKTSRGYGHFTLPDQSQQTVHRFSWQLFRGPVPKGKYVLHDCPNRDNPACCNPDHLWLGSHSDNIQDAYNKRTLRSLR